MNTHVRIWMNGGDRITPDQRTEIEMMLGCTTVRVEGSPGFLFINHEDTDLRSKPLELDWMRHTVQCFANIIQPPNPAMSVIFLYFWEDITYILASWKLSWAKPIELPDIYEYQKE